MTFIYGEWRFRSPTVSIERLSGASISLNWSLWTRRRDADGWDFLIWNTAVLTDAVMMLRRAAFWTPSAYRGNIRFISRLMRPIRLWRQFH